jgi:wyosine [tRNA(Phe)-imidazoG37] synthetase (radical SAM superfamily)
MSTAKVQSHLLSSDDENLLIQGVVYEPIPESMDPTAMGINILGSGQKICSFDCPYCDLGSTTVRLNQLKAEGSFPSLAQLTHEITEAFKKTHTEGPPANEFCVSGNGEPTLHPEFPEVVKAILAARDIWLPGKKISILSNGALADTRKITDALNLFDERIIKIDAGNEKAFKLANAPLSRTNLARVLAGVRKMKDVTVQSLFFGGTLTNTNSTDVDDWIEVIAMLKPKSVRILGMSRPSSIPGLIRCEEDVLYAIASRLERKTQIKSIVKP